MLLCRRVPSRLRTSRHKIRGSRQNIAGPEGVIDERTSEQLGTHFFSNRMSIAVHNARMTPPLFSRLASSICTLLLITSCAGGITRNLREPVTPLDVTTIFVYRTRFAGTPDTTARSMELTQRLINAALDEGSDAFAFYGPTEFRIMRWEDDAAWIASGALPVLTNSGSRPDQGFVLRPRVEKRITGSLQSAADTKGVSKGSSSNEVTTWLGAIEVLHPATRTVLIEVQAQVETDAFASAGADTDFDEAPAMTQMMERLTREAVNLARKYAAPRSSSALPRLEVALTPKSLPVAVEGESMKIDALQAELMLQNRSRFLCPALDDTAAAKLLPLPAGMLVRSSDSAKLSPGDLILAVDGEAALPHVLHRARFVGHPVQLQVKQAAGAETVVVFP